MKQNLIFRTSFRRVNKIMEYIYAVVFFVCSLPRMVIEVFLRVDFGERYFGTAAALTVAFILGVYPFTVSGNSPDHFWDFVVRNPVWYPFIAAFLYFANLRRLEIKRNPKAIDFESYSLSLGYPHPRIEEFFLKYLGYLPDPKVYEIFLEPLLFLVLGFILFLCGQFLGIVFIVCAICYSVSYMAAYHISYNEALDLSDKYVCDQQMKAVYVDKRPPRETKGVRLLGARPTTPRAAELMSKLGRSDDDVADVI